MTAHISYTFKLVRYDKHLSLIQLLLVGYIFTCVRFLAGTKNYQMDFHETWMQDESGPRIKPLFTLLHSVRQDIFRHLC